MNHPMNEAERLHFQDYCRRERKMGNYILFRCDGSSISFCNKDTFKNFLHAQFTREETTMKIKEHKRLLFCRSLYSSLNFARGILTQK